jgi:hypothetical protein
MSGINLNNNNPTGPVKKVVKGAEDLAAKGFTLDETNTTVSTSKGENLSLNNLKKGKNNVKVISLAEKEVPDAVSKSVRKATEASIAGTTKKILGAGVIGVPLDAVFGSFDYHSGKTTTKQYAGKTAGGFVTWSVFEAGNLSAVAVASSVIGRKLGPFGSMVIGVGTGLVVSSLYHKTAGHYVDKGLSSVIPESIAKPFANTMDKYFAKPVDTYILTPIKENPKTSIAIGTALATALAIKYPVGFGLNILAGTAGATAISVGGNIALNQVLPDLDSNVGAFSLKGFPSVSETHLPSIDTPPTREELEWGDAIEKKYQKAPNSVTKAETLKYHNILQRNEKAESAKK